VSQGINDSIQSHAMDQLHRIEVDTVNVAGPVNWNDIGVMQPGGSLSFLAKSLQMSRRPRHVLAQYLQGDSTFQRLLLRLVNDTHSTSSYFTNDVEVTNSFSLPSIVRNNGQHTLLLVLQPLNSDDRRKQFANLSGVTGMMSRELLNGGPIAKPMLFHELLGQHVKGISVYRFVLHALASLGESGSDLPHLTPASGNRFDVGTPSLATRYL
jgi:hypothetical protein